MNKSSLENSTPEVMRDSDSIEDISQLKTQRDRLFYYLNFRGISQAQVCAALGKSQGWLSTMRLGTKTEVLRKFCDIYNEVSFEWLAYGRAPMLNPVSASASDVAALSGSGGAGDSVTLLQNQNTQLQNALRTANSTIEKLSENIARLSEINNEQNLRYMALIERVLVK